MRKVRLALWLGIPCQAISEVFRAFAETHDFEVEIFCFRQLPKDRCQLGWQMPDYGQIPFEFLPTEENARQVRVLTILEQKYDFHLISLNYSYPEHYPLVAALEMCKAPFGILAEGPWNPLTGVRRWLKFAYLLLCVRRKLRHFSRSAKFVCCQSGGAAQHIRWFRWFGFAKDKIYPFGYFSSFAKQNNENAAEKSTDCIHVLCTGYITKVKGQELLIRALANHPEIHSKLEVTITGFGEGEANLRKQIDSHGLGTCVEIVGVVSTERLQQLYAAADIFVAPGIEEPWGIRINEALLAGIPVLISDRIGACELIRASGGGVCFQSGNATMLGDILAQWVSEPQRLQHFRSKIQSYRKKILPSVAMCYLREIILHEVNGSEQPSRLPVWLCGAEE